MSDALDPFRVFVTDLDILRPISSRTVAAKPPGRLDLLAGAPEVPEPATHSWARAGRRLTPALATNTPRTYLSLETFMPMGVRRANTSSGHGSQRE